MSKIEWTDKTWNVITGCTQISPACDNCYAKAMTKRLQGVEHSVVEEYTEIAHSYNEPYQVICAGDCGGLEPHKAFNLPKYYLGWDKVVFHKEALQDILDKKEVSKWK